MAFYKRNKNKNKSKSQNNLKVKSINKRDVKKDSQYDNENKQNTEDNIQSIEQLRAKKALEEITKIREDEDEVTKKEFKSYANELPAMIHMNGLGQAVAFYKSKRDSSNAHRILYKILSDWLGDNRPYKKQAPDKKQDLLINITENSIDDYRIAQAESQAFLVWIKSFAKAYLNEAKEIKNENT